MLDNQGVYKNMFHRFNFNATKDLTDLNGSDIDYIQELGNQLLNENKLAI